jgi:D-glycero-alpha-D-manno-heptose-7-phosphate kinase
MIISRTPLRMSFVGGGSDLPAFYRQFGGAVVSTAINQFVYITVNKKFDEKIRVSYSRTEEARSVARIRHPLVREAMRLVKVDGGVEITSIADIPGRGSGLGSSSSFTVGLLHALHAYAGREVSAEQLAREACEIEIERCGEPIGRQDQYAAAFGGLNFIQFHPDDTVSVEPIRCREETRRTLESRMVVFYTGITRSASAILRGQQVAVTARRKQKVVQRMVELAHELRRDLEAERVGALGAMIHEGWLLKRGIAAGITSERIDEWYGKARRAGAEGGKLLGAGTGGFLLFIAEPSRHEAIVRALAPLRRVDFRLELRGSEKIFVYHSGNP